ncbi:hypothetical protein [Amycolatopsis lurida]|uniref:hypothetical protein n=1 Tax=Amycolatopsis lurida TaxID=31959 RepID=UPI00115F7D99|nr:hypothetical protein [Amycolatopsis lurida]
MAGTTQGDQDAGGATVPLETAGLLRALGAVNQLVPRVVGELASGQMLPDRQREFAKLLQRLAAVLHEHADNQTSGNAATPQNAASCGLLPKSLRHLVEP